jgi:hypothetical protein
MRAAGRRYQASRAGRFAHARRAKRYRRRRREQEIVTHHSSQGPPARATVQADALEIEGVEVVAVAAEPWHCRWCARLCTGGVRRGFLRHSPGHRAGMHGQSP